MKSIIFSVLFFLYFGLLHSQNKSILNLHVLNCQDTILVSLFSFNDIQKDLIYTSKLVNEKCSFFIPNSINDGVYSVTINFPTNNNNLSNVHSFYVILDSSEKEISVEYDFEKRNMPIFFKSKINQNWYSYLLEESKNNSLLENLNSIKDMSSSNVDFKIDKIKTEINKNRELFLKQNFNFWSSNMVRYNDFDFCSTYSFLNEEDFWSKIKTDIPALLNTPVYQNVVQKYVVLFGHGTSNTTELKRLFETIIKRFSENEMVKSWIVKYVKYGISQIGDEQLLDYFSK